MHWGAGQAARWAGRAGWQSNMVRGRQGEAVGATGGHQPLEGKPRRASNPAAREAGPGKRWEKAESGGQRGVCWEKSESRASSWMAWHQWDEDQSGGGAAAPPPDCRSAAGRRDSSWQRWRVPWMLLGLGQPLRPLL